jgi:HEAT repeat protein
VAALGGLGEMGTPADALLALPYLADPRPRVRRAAVRCLAHLAADAHASTLFDALRDDFPSVTRAAREAVAPRLYRVGADRLWLLFQDDPRPHVRRAALALLAGLSKWEAVAHLVRALAEGDAMLAREATAALKAWIARYNQSFLEPTRQQLAALAAALDDAGEATPPEIRQSLRHVHTLGDALLRRHVPRR